jgi:hypothetical protein
MEVDSRQVVVVYYRITYFKAVRVGEGDSGRHVLRDTRLVWTSLPITH